MVLSIIVPIYNVEDYIEKCLLSIFNQKDLEDVEIILVDDCGNDKSIDIVYEIINNYSKKCNIKIISHTNNQGLSAARNSGVKHAVGEYLLFLDSDDELSIDSISIFKKNLSLYGYVDCFIGNYSVLGNFKESKFDIQNKIYENNQSIYEAYMNGLIYPMAWGKFIKRTFFETENLWFPIKRLHEDLLFSFKFALKAKSIKIITENIYIYRIREYSITTKKKRKNYIDIVWIISEQLKLLYNRNIIIDTFGYNYISTLSYNLVLTTCQSNLSFKEKIIILNWIKKMLKEYNVNYTKKSLFKSCIMFLPSLVIIILSKIFYSLRTLIK